MQDYRINKSQITASSEWTWIPDASNARLNGKSSVGKTGIWCADVNNLNHWVSVDLGVSRLVSGVITQGRNGVEQWVTEFKIQYGVDGITWHYIVDSMQEEKVRAIYVVNEVLHLLPLN